jgi:hypothetical protein
MELLNFSKCSYDYSISPTSDVRAVSLIRQYGGYAQFFMSRNKLKPDII